MPLTAATFAQRVGQRLGIVRAAESLSHEDAKTIREAYAALWSELYAHDLTRWDVSGDIPDEVADILIGMTAARTVDEFGVAEPRRGQIVAQYDFGLPVPTPAERRLRRLQRAATDNEALEIEFF